VICAAPRLAWVLRHTPAPPLYLAESIDNTNIDISNDSLLLNLYNKNSDLTMIPCLLIYLLS